MYHLVTDSGKWCSCAFGSMSDARDAMPGTQDAMAVVDDLGLIYAVRDRAAWHVDRRGVVHCDRPGASQWSESACDRRNIARRASLGMPALPSGCRSTGRNRFGRRLNEEV